MASFSVDNFLRTFNGKLEEPVRAHLKNVYTCLAMSTLSTAVGAYIHLFTYFLSGSLLTIVGALGFLMALHWTSDDNGKNRKQRLGYLMAFAFFTGLGLGPFLEMALFVDPSIVPTAFMVTSGIFVCFSLSSLLSARGEMLMLGAPLMSLITLMTTVIFANLFFGSSFLYQAQLYLGLAVMCGFILYDTQLIVEKRRAGDKDYVAHSLDLFIDFIGVFRRLLIILTQKESQRKNRKD